MEIERMQKKNTKCDIQDSSLCRWLDKKECSRCYVLELADKEKAEALHRWEVTQSLLPDNIDELHLSETCHFCMHDPLPKSHYATVDFAHEEPESTKSLFFGFGKKVRTKIGSLLPLSIACCGRCRKAFFMVDFIKFAIPAVVLLIGVLLMLIPPVTKAINGIHELAGTAFIVVMFLIGLLAGKQYSSYFMRRKTKDVRLNVFEIPVVAKMKDIGWFVLQDQEGEVTKMIFTKNKFYQARMLKFKND